MAYNKGLNQVDKDRINQGVKDLVAQGKSREEIIAWRDAQVEAAQAAAQDAGKIEPAAGEAPTAGGDSISDDTSSVSQPQTTIGQFAQTAGKKKPRLDDDGEEVNLAKDFGEFGAAVESIPFIGDLIDDMYGAVKSGYAQGQTVDDALALFKAGEDADPETIQKYIEAVEAQQNNPVSQEMQDFNATYEEAGGGAWGFIKAIAQNPSVAAATAVSSMVAMINPASALGAAAGGAAGAGIGAGFAGVGALPGGLGGAFAGAGGILETGTSFTEFLQEELAEKGLEFNEEGIAKVLEDPDALMRIRGKSAARGGVIAVIDGLTAGIASKAAKGVANTAKTASALKGTLAATAIEGVGGGVGEATARAVVGQEMDAREIGLEIVGEFGTGVSIGQAALASQPKYTVNGQVVNRAQVETILKSDPAAAGAIKVENDPKLKDEVNQATTGLKSINKNADVITKEESAARGKHISAIAHARQQQLGKKKSDPQWQAWDDVIRREKDALKTLTSEQNKIYDALSPEDLDILRNAESRIANYDQAIETLQSKYKEGQQPNADDADAIEKFQNLKQETSDEVSEVRARGQQIAQEKAAKKAQQEQEVAQQEAVAQEAEEQGVSTAAIEQSKADIEEQINDDVDTNGKKIQGLSEELVDLGVDVTPAQGQVDPSKAETYIPLSKDDNAFTMGDFEKTISSYEPRSLAEVKKAEMAVKRHASEIGAIADTKIETLEDGTAVLSGTLKSPKRETALSEQFAPQAEEAPTEEVVNEEGPEINDQGNVVGEKVFTGEEGPVKRRTAISTEERNKPIDVISEEYNAEKVGENQFIPENPYRFINRMAQSGHRVDIDEDTGVATVFPGEGPQFSAEEEGGVKKELFEGTRQEHNDLRGVEGSDVELNIGLNNNPYGYQEMINLLGNNKDLILGTTQEGVSEYADWGEEPTLVVKAKYRGNESSFRNYIKKLAKKSTQESIAVKSNGVGSLIYDPARAIGERYTFDPKFFIDPINTKAAEAKSAEKQRTDISDLTPEEKFELATTGSRRFTGDFPKLRSPEVVGGVSTGARESKKIISAGDKLVKRPLPASNIGQMFENDQQAKKALKEVDDYLGFTKQEAKRIGDAVNRSPDLAKLELKALNDKIKARGPQPIADNSISAAKKSFFDGLEAARARGIKETGPLSLAEKISNRIDHLQNQELPNAPNEKTAKSIENLIGRYQALLAEGPQREDTQIDRINKEISRLRAEDKAEAKLAKEEGRTPKTNVNKIARLQGKLQNLKAEKSARPLQTIQKERGINPRKDKFEQSDIDNYLDTRGELNEQGEPTAKSQDAERNLYDKATLMAEGIVNKNPKDRFDAELLGAARLATFEAIRAQDYVGQADLESSISNAVRQAVRDAKRKKEGGQRVTVLPHNLSVFQGKMLKAVEGLSEVPSVENITERLNELYPKTPMSVSEVQAKMDKINEYDAGLSESQVSPTFNKDNEEKAFKIENAPLYAPKAKGIDTYSEAILGKHNMDGITEEYADIVGELSSNPAERKRQTSNAKKEAAKLVDQELKFLNKRGDFKNQNSPTIKALNEILQYPDNRSKPVDLWKDIFSPEARKRNPDGVSNFLSKMKTQLTNEAEERALAGKQLGAATPSPQFSSKETGTTNPVLKREDQNAVEAVDTHGMSTEEAVAAIKDAMSKMKDTNDYVMWIGGKVSKNHDAVLKAIKDAGMKSRFSRLGSRNIHGRRRIHFPGAIANYSVLEEVARPPAPAQIGLVNNMISQLESVFPGTEVVTDMNRISQEVPGFGPQHKGAYYLGKVYLNTSKVTADTPLHEFTHLWMDKIAIEDIAFFNRGKELFYGSQLAADTKRRYPGLKGMAFWKEVLTNAIGKHGTKLFNDKKKAGIWDRWVNKFTRLVKESLGIKSPDDYSKLTVDQWLDIASTKALTGDTQIFNANAEAKPQFSIQEDPDAADDVIVAKELGKKADWRKILGVKVPRNFISWLVPPAADDAHGLISKLNIPEAKEMLKKYVTSHHEYVKASDALRANVKRAIDTLGPGVLNKTQVNHKGLDLTGAQAIQAHIDGISSPSIDRFVSKPNVQRYINEMQSLQVLKPSPQGRDYTMASTDFDVIDYITKGLYNEKFGEFNEQRSKIFNQKALNKIRGEKGNRYADALENALGRLASGKNAANISDPTTRKWNDWAQGSVGTIMFWNFRSAALQLLSVGNYGFSDNVNSAKFVGELAKGIARLPFDLLNKDSGLRKRLDSAYLRERRARAGFDVNMSELADSIGDSKSFGDITKKFLNWGFKATSAVDSLAIALGGEAYAKSYTGDPNNLEASWIEQSEEAQQSSRPDRVSQWQTTGISKFVLAFANTPAQYFRLGQKALRTIRDPQSSTKQKIGAASRVLWYMAAQNAIFVALQSASHGIFDEDEEEVKSAYNSMADSLLRGMGLYGAVISALKNVLYEADRQSEKSNPDYISAMLKATTITPPLNKKINDLLAIGRGYQYQREDKHAIAVAKGVAVTTNLPTDWALKKYDAAVNLWSDEYGKWQKLLMLLGYSPYALDKEGQTSDFGDESFDEGDFDEGGFDEGEF